MAKATVADTPAVETPVVEAPAPEVHNITIEEFSWSISAHELKAGFARHCQINSIIGQKTKEEWDKILKLYLTLPAKVKWADWVAKGGK
jgi:hypothetical protein